MSFAELLLVLGLGLWPLARYGSWKGAPAPEEGITPDAGVRFRHWGGRGRGGGGGESLGDI